MTEAQAKGVTIRSLLKDGRKIAILDRLLSEADDEKLSEEDIREEVDTFISGGHETSGRLVKDIFTVKATPHTL